MEKQKEKLRKSNINEHLSELRKRLVLCAVFFLIALVFTYNYSSWIYEFLLSPLADLFKSSAGTKRVMFTKLTEGFTSQLRVSMFGAFILSVPFFVIQLYKFLSPALYKNEKKIIIPMMFASVLLFASGALLVYYFVIPQMWKFFIGFQSVGILPVNIELDPKISEYVALSTSVIVAFGLVFQIPIALMLLLKWGVVSIGQLKKYRKFVFLFAFLLSAIITPPDVVSQVILGFVIYLLYALSIFIGQLIWIDK